MAEATKADISRLEQKMDQHWQSVGEDIYALNCVLEEHGKDISQIKRTMATKEDLKRFVTKADLAQLEQRMATKEELRSVKEQMATKADLAKVTLAIEKLTEKLA